MNIIKEAILSLKKYRFTVFTTIIVLTFNMLILEIFVILIINLNSFFEGIKNNVAFAAVFGNQNLKRFFGFLILTQSEINPA